MCLGTILISHITSRFFLLKVTVNAMHQVYAYKLKQQVLNSFKIFDPGLDVDMLSAAT